MKKVICFLLVLMMLLSSAAMAENSRITGTITDAARGEGTVQLLAGENGFDLDLKLGDLAVILSGAAQEDGTLLIAKGDVALRVAAPDLQKMLAPLLLKLSTQPTYENAMYSSKYIQAQQVEISGAQVSAIGLALLNACPLADRDGSLRMALNGLSQSGETCATLTRYTADQQQYPNDSLMQLSVFSSALPYLFGEIETDEYGSSFTIAFSEGKVTDWDETIAELSEGKTAGKLYKGFTMLDASLRYTEYVWAEIFGYENKMELEAEIDNVSGGNWSGRALLADTDNGVHLLYAALQGAATGDAPSGNVSVSLTVDGTDGLDAAELELLGF